jgi:predicted RNA-binding Zn-ribbon protein involved in translation (DUF1610 family)
MSMRTLIIDVEVAPNQVYTWGLWRQNVAITQIEEPGYLLSFAAKWHGEDGMIFKSVHHDGHKEMARELWLLLDEADAIVGYNSKSFDLKWIKALLLEHEYGPPSEYADIDLLTTVRREFKHPSNKLQYIVQKLGLDGKVEHEGFGLWLKCMDGDEEAWETMQEYNEHDVVLTEELYDILLPWITTHPNVALWISPDTDDPTCPKCGSKKVYKNGTKKTQVMEYQRWRCNACGANSRSRKKLAKSGEGILR